MGLLPIVLLKYQILGGLNLQVLLCLGNGVGWGRKGVFKEERGKRSSLHSYQKRARITARGVLFH